MKVCIIQNGTGKTYDDNVKERLGIVRQIEEAGDKVLEYELRKGRKFIGDVKCWPLYALACQMEAVALEADLIYFPKDWAESACGRIARMCCELYNIPLKDGE